MSTEVILPIAALYITISSNFIGELFSPEIRDVLERRWVKHVVGLFTMLLITLHTKTNEAHFAFDTIKAIFLYTTFILTTKCDKRVTIAIIFGFCIFYVTELYQKNNRHRRRQHIVNNDGDNSVHDHVETDDNKERKRIKYVIGGLVFILLVYGVFRKAKNKQVTTPRKLFEFFIDD